MGRSLNYLFPKNFKKRFPRTFEFLRFVKNGDMFPFLRFAFRRKTGLSFGTRVSILNRLFWIGTKVESPHTNGNILEFVNAMIDTRELAGDYVECGCYKGSSTSKFSIVAQLLGKKIIVFDSFEGIPDNEEQHDLNIYGEKSGFRKGDFAGTYDEVLNNVTNCGKIEACEFNKGWFDQTMPGFHRPLSAAYIDVDLASSTKTCIQFLYPLIQPGGIMMSQDGHLPLVIEVFRDQDFWQTNLGIDPPEVVGLGTKKIIYFRKEFDPKRK